MKKIISISLAIVFSVSIWAQVDRSIQPKPGAAPTINFGKPKTFKLPNGLTTIVVENHKLPSVTFALKLDNPLSNEGEIKGVDNLTSSMMGNGTSRTSKDDFNRQIDYYGAYVQFSINSVSGSTLSRYFSEVLSLSAQGSLDPLFTEEELNSEKAKLIESLKADEKSAQRIASEVGSSLIYGKQHPFGEIMTKSTIDKVSLDNVKKYYSEYFVPANAYLVIVGDVKFDEVKELVKKNFSAWKKASAPKSMYNEPQNLSKIEIDFIDLPNTVQSQISVNNLVTLKMNDPDYFAAIMANHILGGGGEGRLFLNLREAHGWTYGSYSSILGDKHTTKFTAQASVRNAVTDSAVVEMLNEINRIRTSLPTQQELDQAKAKYIGNFVMNIQKPKVIADYALRMKTQNLPENFFKNYIKNINAVTLEQVQAAATKHIKYDNARIVIVGKGSEVLPGLERLNIPIKYYDNLGNPTDKPETKEVSSDVTAKSVLSKYIDAIGGKEALMNVKSVMMELAMSIQGQTINSTIKQTNDGKMLQEITGMGMTIMKTVLNGETGYTIVQGQKQELTNDMIDAIKKPIFPELDELNSSDVQLLGIETINNADAYKIKSGNTTNFYDIKSGLMVAEESTINTNGQTITQRSYKSNYKEFNGIKFPCTITTNMMGMDIDGTITNLEINKSVSDSDFD